jgi:hypothetical protein
MPWPSVLGVVLVGGTSTKVCRVWWAGSSTPACGWVGSGRSVRVGWVVGTLLGPEGAGREVWSLCGPPGGRCCVCRS